MARRSVRRDIVREFPCEKAQQVVSEIHAASDAINKWLCPNCGTSAPVRCTKCGFRFIEVKPLPYDPRATFNRRYVKKAKGNYA